MRRSFDDMNLEHPEIKEIQMTGYPSGYKAVSYVCEECGKDLREATIYEDDSHECLCKRCLLQLHEKEWWF